MNELFEGFELINMGGFDRYRKYPPEIRITFSTDYMEEESTRFVSLAFENYTTMVTPRMLASVATKKGIYYGFDGELITLKNLEKYFNDYHLGFLDGYKNFEIMIRDQAGLFDDKETISNRIYDCIKLDLNRHKDPVFSFNLILKKTFLDKNDFFKNGKEQGIQYKAWFSIFENPNNFKDLFNKDENAIVFYKNCIKIGIFKNVETINYFETIINRFENEKKEQKSLLKLKQNQLTTTNLLAGLTAFELALRHWHLVKARVEPYILARQVGEKYKELKSWKNIQSGFLKIDSSPQKRSPKLNELQNILSTLLDFPEIQKAISNEIDKLDFKT
jgi:hypothetical protein